MLRLRLMWFGIEFFVAIVLVLIIKRKRRKK